MLTEVVNLGRVDLIVLAPKNFKDNPASGIVLSSQPVSGQYEYFLLLKYKRHKFTFLFCLKGLKPCLLYFPILCRAAVEYNVGNVRALTVFDTNQCPKS